jgi:hypothetical protein
MLYPNYCSIHYTLIWSKFPMSKRDNQSNRSVLGTGLDIRQSCFLNMYKIWRMFYNRIYLIRIFEFNLCKYCMTYAYPCSEISSHLPVAIISVTKHHRPALLIRVIPLKVGFFRRFVVNVATSFTLLIKFKSFSSFEFVKLTKLKSTACLPEKSNATTFV